MVNRQHMDAGVTCRAPGKLILSGEHAVVYGCPAVAVAVNRYAVAEAKPSADGIIHLQAPQFCETTAWSLEDAVVCVARIEQQYAEFLAGKRPIRTVLNAASELLLYAVMQAGVHAEGISVRVETDIPVGCGMGSSASVTAAICGAVDRLHGRELSHERLYEMVMACERLQHGHPSGVDAYVAVHGGGCLFRKNHPVETMSPSVLGGFLVNSGEPESTTGDCVEQVKMQYSASAIWNVFSEATQKVKTALETGNEQALNEAIRANHQLLVRIAVVPARIQQFVQQIEASGGCAKICGAGSVKGHAAGMIWALAEPTVVRDLCAEAGWHMLAVQPDLRGVV